MTHIIIYSLKKTRTHVTRYENIPGNSLFFLNWPEIAKWNIVCELIRAHSKHI